MRRAAAVTSVAVLLASALAPRTTGAEPPKGQSESFRYDPQGKRDPFVPLVRDGRLLSGTGSGAVSTGEPTLHGILWDPNGHSLALIDDTEVKVGDTVAGYQVTEIRQDGVVLKNGEKSVVLTVFEVVGPGATTGGARP